MVDFEFNPIAAGIAGVLSALFITMIWKVSTWDNYPFKSKMIISILLPIIAYFVVQWQMNK